MCDCKQDELHEEAFLTVWGGDPHRPPTVKHTPLAQASAEAMRLAQLHPGTTFYVLRSVAAYRAEIEIKAVFLETPAKAEG